MYYGSTPPTRGGTPPLCVGGAPLTGEGGGGVGEAGYLPPARLAVRIQKVPPFLPIVPYP